MRLSPISTLGTLLTALTLGFVAAPAQAGGNYGGIGATVSHFDAHNAHGSGTPPVGTAYYRIAGRMGRAGREDRVTRYHVVLNPQSKLSTAELKRLVTTSELPRDAKQIKRWKPSPAAAYCAVYRSRWLGRQVYRSRWLKRRVYGPYAVVYVVVYVSSRYQTASATISAAPYCRG